MNYGSLYEKKSRESHASHVRDKMLVVACPLQVVCAFPLQTCYLTSALSFLHCWPSCCCVGHKTLPLCALQQKVAPVLRELPS